MRNTPDSADRDLQNEEEEMNGPETVLQRLRDERSRGGPFQLFGLRVSWPILVGGLVVVVLVMAFLLRPGEEVEPGTAPVAKPAATSAPAAASVPTKAAAPTPTIPVATQQRVHTVESGDTLSILAEKYYGDPSKFAVIYEANKDILTDPDSLQLGQELKIPD